MRAVPSVYSATLAAVILAPLVWKPGYLLLRDAVSTPRSYLTDTALGLGDAAPRAVPQDALLAVVTRVADGGLVVTAITVAALWLAGWGAAVMARLVIAASLPGQLVAATLMVWNPFVAERLLQGHWSLFVGYAALPWMVVALVGRGERSDGGVQHASVIRAVLPLACASLTPTGGILAVIVGLVVAQGRRRLAVLALGVACWTPWLVAALVGTGSEPSDPTGVPAFAARAEPALGTLGSLAGLGGIWNSNAVPTSRTTLFALVGTAVLVGIVVLGARHLLPRGGLPVRLLVLAVVAIVLPAVVATPWGMTGLQWAVAHVPGAGLLRDTQKYVALAAPGFAVAAAALANRWRGASSGACGASMAVAVMVALVCVLPDLAFGVGGQVRSVQYPASWERVASASRDVTGDIAVLPAGMFRKFPYSGPAPVLDPAPRMVPREVLQTGDLAVRGHVVAGEGTRARQVQDALLRGTEPRQLANLGVGAVLVERDTPGPRGESARTLDQLRPLYADTHLALYAVPGPITVHPPARRGLAIAAHLLWAALLLVGLGVSLNRSVRRSGRPE